MTELYQALAQGLLIGSTYGLLALGMGLDREKERRQRETGDTAMTDRNRALEEAAKIIKAFRPTSILYPQDDWQSDLAAAIAALSASPAPVDGDTGENVARAMFLQAYSDATGGGKVSPVDLEWREYESMARAAIVALTK